MSRRLSTVSWIVAVVLCLAGVVFLVIGWTTPPSAESGWFAYQPLANAVFVPGIAVTSPYTLTGMVLLSIGLLGTAFLSGLAVGARRGRTRPTDG